MTSSGSLPSGIRTTPTSVRPSFCSEAWTSLISDVSSVTPNVPAL